MNEQSFMTETKPSSLMRKYSIPCIVSLLVAALYNIVDQIFIANAPYLGSNGNAANTAVFPLTVLALAFALLIGDGACASSSIFLGQNDNKKASSTIANAIIASIVTGVVIMVIFLAFSSGLLALFGGNVNEQTLAFAREYFFWITLGIPFYVLGQALNPIIRADGSPKFAMCVIVLGAVINLVLDPIFIYGFHWGMMGAAVATTIGQIVSALISVWYLFHFKTIHLERSSFAFAPKLLGKLLFLGINSFLAQLSLVVSMAAVQNMILKYGALDPVFSQSEYAQIPLAILGIVMKFFQIVISAAVGLAAGMIPVVGFNIGAGRRDRAWSMFKLILGFEALIGFVALVIVELFPQQLLALFGSANESAQYVTFGIKCFRIYLCMMVLATVNKGCFIFLQAMGKALESSLISLCREVVFGVGLPILLPVFFGLDGVLYSFPLADILTFLIADVVIFQTRKELKENKVSAGALETYESCEAV